MSVLHKNVSQILAIMDFFKQRNYRKNLVSKEENYRYITLSQTSCLNLHKFGIGNYISDCPSAPFTGLDLIFCVIYVSERTYFKLIIDFRLECFQAGGWESQRNVQINVSYSKLICESSLSRAKGITHKELDALS